MVQNIKKYFKNFLLISGGILMASCNTKPIENEHLFLIGKKLVQRLNIILKSQLI